MKKNTVPEPIGIKSKCFDAFDKGIVPDVSLPTRRKYYKEWILLKIADTCVKLAVSGRCHEPTYYVKNPDLKKIYYLLKSGKFNTKIEIK